MARGRVAVFGPAYLDRVLRVDGPLLDRALSPPIDQSALGRWKFGTGTALELLDPGGMTIAIELPDDWPGPAGEVELVHSLSQCVRGRRTLRGLDWHDDLGGMGAGYAAALGGVLYCALGAESDVTSQVIARRLAGLGIEYHPVRVPDRAADWTLLITSGPFGDKLAVGFRGCHAALALGSLDEFAAQSCELCVVASLPNPSAARVLRASAAEVRLFAPGVRNMLDRASPVASFAASIDVLCCNRMEWETLEDREEVAWQLSILVVTEGTDGSTIGYTTPAGDPGLVKIPAFPRERPPRDTNRAGEAYAATFIRVLRDHGWCGRTGVIEEALVRQAAVRAAAAAALVLDRLQFGFPAPAEIDAALAAGRVF
jgi:ribokinase